MIAAHYTIAAHRIANGEYGPVLVGKPLHLSPTIRCILSRDGREVVVEQEDDQQQWRQVLCVNDRAWQQIPGTAFCVRTFATAREANATLIAQRAENPYPDR